MKISYCTLKSVYFSLSQMFKVLTVFGQTKSFSLQGRVPPQFITCQIFNITTFTRYFLEYSKNIFVKYTRTGCSTISTRYKKTFMRTLIRCGLLMIKPDHVRIGGKMLRLLRYVFFPLIKH